MPEDTRLVLGILIIVVTSSAVPVVVSQNASEGKVTVPTNSNIYASGRDKVPELPHGGGVMPVEIDVTNAEVVTFPSATGEIDSGIGGEGPGGKIFEEHRTDIDSYKGISGIVHRKSFFLGGVFLSDSDPPDSAPEPLNFTNNDNFTSISPKKGQVFYIGDGKNDEGELQRFKVPDGATKLYLGIPDAGFFKGKPGTYGDNTGEIRVTYRLSGSDRESGSNSSPLPGFGFGVAVAAILGVAYILRE